MSEWVRRSGIQLAYPFEEKRLASWDPPYLLDPKLDGDRCRTIFDKHKSVELLSSEENSIWSVPIIKQELESTCLRDLELDGELYIHGRPQAETHGIISTQRVSIHEDHHKVEYHLFDLIDLNTPTQKRRYYLNVLYQEHLKDLPHIKIIPFYVINTLEEVYKGLEYFMSLGYEGFILRKFDELYRRKRSIYMMKFKPKKQDVYLIVGFNEAIDQHKQPMGMVGSFLCRSPPKPEIFPIGAGRIKHDERRTIWENQEAVLGKPLHVYYQHLTAKNGVPRSGVAVEVLYDA